MNRHRWSRWCSRNSCISANKRDNRLLFFVFSKSRYLDKYWRHRNFDCTIVISGADSLYLRSFSLFHINLKKIRFLVPRFFFVKFSNYVESAETLHVQWLDIADYDGAVDIPVSPIFSEISTFWKNKKYKFIISLVSGDKWVFRMGGKYPQTLLQLSAYGGRWSPPATPAVKYIAPPGN